MIIKESFEVPVAKSEAVTFLLDVPRMSACVPGVQDVRAIGEDEYEAVLRLQLGPIRSNFSGRARLDASGAPDRLTATAEGRDRSTSSQVQVRFEAEVSEHPGPRTVVDCTADVTIRGRLGQFGTGLITSTAKTVLREFADCASSTLIRAGEARTSADAPVLAAPAPSLRVWRVLRRGLALYVRGLWARVRRSDASRRHDS